MEAQHMRLSQLSHAEDGGCCQPVEFGVHRISVFNASLDSVQRRHVTQDQPLLLSWPQSPYRQDERIGLVDCLELCVFLFLWRAGAQKSNGT